MGYRLFIFEADGTMRHIPQRIANGLHLGNPPLPEYAGSKLRYALVFLATDNRRPSEITRIDAGYFSFDQGGNPQRELARGGMEAWTTGDKVKDEKAQTGQVVSVTARLARKKMGAGAPLDANTSRGEPYMRCDLAKEGFGTSAQNRATAGADKSPPYQPRRS